jgi:hypothetical protein
MLRVAAEYDCAWPIKQRFLNFKMSQIKSLDSLRTVVNENEDEKQKNIREPRGDCSHVSTENYNYEDASLSLRHAVRVRQSSIRRGLYIGLLGLMLTSRIESDSLQGAKEEGLPPWQVWQPSGSPNALPGTWDGGKSESRQNGSNRSRAE